MSTREDALELRIDAIELARAEPEPDCVADARAADEYTREER